jgi:hypothetical protein
MTAASQRRDVDERPASGDRSVKDLLTRREGRGLLIQELCPIAESIAWFRSQRYWAEAGIEVFTSGEVPYIVTNDGDQSRKGVELYVASLRDAERQRRDAHANYVLEFGTGTGLFAKSFLDQLQARSRADGTRDYEHDLHRSGSFARSTR